MKPETLQELLEEFFPDKDSRNDWLDEPHRLLDGDTPRGRIESGDEHSVKIILFRAAHGVFS